MQAFFNKFASQLLLGLSAIVMIVWFLVFINSYIDYAKALKDMINRKKRKQATKKQTQYHDDYLEQKLQLPQCFKDLGFKKLPKNETEVKKAYRNLAKKHHPDAGGSPREFQRINEAYTECLTYF